MMGEMLTVLNGGYFLIALHKPKRQYRASEELYQHETLTIDSSSTVLSSCGNCHDLRGVHSQSHVSASAGVGISVGPLSGSATVDGDLNLNLSAQLGQNGPVAVFSATHVTNTGPRIVVNSGTRSVQISGSQTSTQSASADNTRSGG